MERREIANGAALALFAAVVGALIGATAVGSASPYFDPLWIGGIVALLVSLAIVSYLFVTAAARKPIVTGDTFSNSGNNFGHMGPVNNYEDRSPKRRLHNLLSSIDRRIPNEARTKRELVVRMEPHDFDALQLIIAEAGGATLVAVKGFGRGFSESVIRVNTAFSMALAAYNLVRLPKLLGA